MSNPRKITSGILTFICGSGAIDVINHDVYGYVVGKMKKDMFNWGIEPGCEVYLTSTHDCDVFKITYLPKNCTLTLEKWEQQEEEKEYADGCWYDDDDGHPERLTKSVKIFIYFDVQSD